MIRTKCLKCGDEKLFAEDKNGKKFHCPICNEIILIEVPNPEYNNPQSITFIDDTPLQDANLQYLIEERNTNYEQQYKKLLKKAQNRKIWALIIMLIVVGMVFSNAPYFATILWGLVSVLFFSKAANLEKEAEKIKKKIK